MSDIIRTPRDGCFEVRSNIWGAFLISVADPESNATLEPDALKGFELHSDIAPIPAALWSRWVQLCFHFVDKVKSTSEVSCRLLRHEDDKSKWRILVPQQAVDGAAVRVESFDEAIDIETGEVITSYPPQGWVPCGSSHSHNTMSSFFSGTDDKYELGDPGLHIVVGDIDVKSGNYTLKASITANKRRFEIAHAGVIDTTPMTEPFHPDVLSAVTAGIYQPSTQKFFDSSKNKAAQDSTRYLWGKTRLRPSLNAGNGFPDDDDLMGRPLFSDITDSGNIDLFDLTEEITGYANECLFTGDSQGVDTMLNTLRSLLDDIEQAFYVDIQSLQQTDEHPADNSAMGSNSAATRTLPLGQW